MLLVTATHHGEVGVIFGETQAQFRLHLWRHSPQHAVKYVIVPLVKSLKKRGRFQSERANTKYRTYDQTNLTCRHTRDFSSKYCSILAPSMAPRLLKWISMYFPKRLELSFRMVLALPNAEWMDHTCQTLVYVPVYSRARDTCGYVRSRITLYVRLTFQDGRGL